MQQINGLNSTQIIKLQARFASKIQKVLQDRKKTQELRGTLVFSGLAGALSVYSRYIKTGKKYKLGTPKKEKVYKAV